MTITGINYNGLEYPANWHGGYRISDATAFVQDTVTEPITLAEAKLHLRVDHEEENTYITSLIVSARFWAENYTKRSFISRSLRLSMDWFPDVILLPRGVTQSVTSIKYYDTGGVDTTLSSSVYSVDTDNEPARITLAYNQSWPDFRAIANTIRIVWVSGYGAAATAVPDPIKQSMKLAIGHWYENREIVPIGHIVQELPMAAKALLDPFRIKEFF